MAAPTIPAAQTQAVNTVGATQSFTVQWYNFFASLVGFAAGPGDRVGFADGSNAPAGDVGEYLSAFRLVGSAINLPNATAVQITTLALTAGDWDVSGNIFFQPTGSNLNAVAGAMSIASAIAPVVPADGADRAVVEGITANDIVTLNGLWARVSIATPTTYFLVALVNLGAATTCVGYGGLRARRVR